MFPGAGSNENVGDAVATLPPPMNTAMDERMLHRTARDTLTH